MYSAIAGNKRKTVLIMFFFVLFVGALGWLFSQVLADGQPSITVGVLIGALIYTVITYYSGSKMALALNGARRIEKRENPRLYRIVENLSIADGLPMPAVYMIDDPSPNAFATGRDPNHSAVCVTSGLLSIMDDQELEGVLAHEMGHVKNYDIRVSMVAFALTAVVSLIADIMIRWMWYSDDDDGKGNQYVLLLGIVAAVLSPIVATMIQLAISRQREYLADATGAMTTRYPEGLERALAKIAEHGSVLKKQNTATAHLFFANPLKKKTIAGLFSTHPPIGDRIKRLRDMGRQA